ncbi:recombinase family protein [Brachybacterium hainanense]|uniref:Recombinase family protein n=1 Tax=Brachybacterium hainanense TaxID=1541174 RepID=A0ABV6RC63_9MICO
MSEPVHAAIYVRISRDSEALGLGVKRQEKDCRKLAEDKHWVVADEDVYIDNDVSASKRRARPRYEAMMKAVASGRVQAIVVWDVDRLTRKPRELEDWIDYADDLGLELASCGGEIDLATPQGRAMARMKGTFARLEAETIGKRQRAKHREMAEAGRYVGPRPFGYRFATDSDGRVLTGAAQRLVVDDAEAAVIRECVQRVLEGQALWTIMKDLNRRGITTATGHEWRSQPLRRMLLRWTHAGYRKHQEFKDERWVGPVHLHEADWEAIIDRETHERVVAKLTDPGRVSNRGDTSLKYLLTWIAECGVCERPLVGASQHAYMVKGYKRKDGTRSPDRQRVYPAKYICPHPDCHGVSRRMDDVDEFVERHVLALLEAEGVRVFGGDQAVVEAARARIDAITSQRLMLSDLATTPVDEGGLDEAQFKRQNAKLSQQLKIEQARLKAAQPAEGFDAFIGADATAAWKSARVDQRRAVLDALTEMGGLRITVDKIGPGAFSAKGADKYAGIRVEWAEAAATRGAS